MLTITERKIGDVVVLDLEGNLIIGRDSETFREKIASLLRADNKKILLNLEKLGYIDHSGIGQLVSSYINTKNRGGSFKLLRLSGKIRNLLSITKLITIFEVFDDESKALASFF